MDLSAAHSHLFRGCRLQASAGFPTSAGAVRLVLGDGEEVDAELLDEGPAGAELALAVPEHQTAAGTTIPSRVWIVQPFDDGLVVGERL